MISVIVITKNEERNIRECLQSVRWAEEIVVVDAESTDSTVEYAGEFTENIFVRPWAGYGESKNFALSQCHGEWILWLDADERITAGLQQEIRSAAAANDPGISAYSMPRLANFLGHWIHHCGWYPGRVVRLFRKSAGKFSENKVHEYLTVDGTIAALHADILHYTDPDLRHYYDKFNRYTSLAAEELCAKGKRFSVLKLIVNPLWIFLKMYIFRLGFLDGMAGLILSALSANYVFTKYAKVWESQMQQKEDNQ